MRVVRPCSLLSAAALPLGYALQADPSRNTCPWSGVSPDFGRFMQFPMDIMEFPDDVQDPGSFYANSGISSLERNTWRTSPDCFEEYCVYTSDGFFDKGISLITTASNHARVAHIQPPQKGSTSHQEKTRIANIPGKGKGLVATRMIHRGDRIMTTSPALLVHRNAFRELSLEDINYLMDVAVNNLPKSRKESYMSQAGSRKIIDILFTNSFQVTLGGNDGFHYGNYPEVSILNHDCRPNMAFYVDNNLTHHTHAVRDIKPGEELTISYVDTLQIRSARQERLRNSLGFSCACSSCTLSKEESNASDNRIRAISRIESELSDFNSKTTSPAMIEEYLSLYRTEGLDNSIAGAYTLAALNYNFFGNAKLAEKYAQLSVEAGQLENGPDAGDVREMIILAKNPKSHWSWNVKPYRL
ncbi:hypothetical protein F5B22DRAFT_256352 [Xylaria bambusicola]|uniref:uncharacterized protein n=1 Tax=Xylaria bambusicola TaxID=326684 RepID=UPI002008A9E8|nr:uncharacterized protein F5B22DRAFT_256352 [Xylaria bambusicola]KAI0525847.1 hypothetical protein F5B22DRAFT_256352 [Xylaria bambusicola]